MKYLNRWMFILLMSGCLTSTPEEQKQNLNSYDLGLVAELKTMADTDQAVQQRFVEITAGTLSFPEFEAAQDSVFRKNGNRLKEIFEVYGYPDYDLVGKEGEYHFWLMVQHCDFDIEFQRAVMERMGAKVYLKKADPANFGYLTDRVAINSGAKQIYGTQIDYNTSIGQAFALPVLDSANVDIRRKNIGLSPLYEYLNARTDDFWQMNPELIIKNKLTKKPYYNP